MAGGMGGWNDVRMEKWEGGRMDGRMESWEEGWVAGWRDGRKDGWKDGNGTGMTGQIVLTESRLQMESLC